MSYKICERIECNRKPSWVVTYQDKEKDYYCNKHKPLTIKPFGTEQKGEE